MNINNVIRYLLVLSWIYVFIYILISMVVRKGYCDPHSISEGGGNAHLKVVCQPPLKEKRKRRSRGIVAVAELFGTVAGRTSSGRLILIRSVFILMMFQIFLMCWSRASDVW